MKDSMLYKAILQEYRLYGKQYSATMSDQYADNDVGKRAPVIEVIL